MMHTPTDATRELRGQVATIIIVVAVALTAAKVVGVENLYEPSRYKPATPQSYGANKEDPPTRVWPANRPDATPMFGSNDRSRWATVRAIVEQGTYVVGKRGNLGATEPPFADSGIIFEESYNSIDKVMVPETGEFYSSKPPLFATLLAGEYAVLYHGFGLSIVNDRWLVVCIILLSVNVLPFALYLVRMWHLIESTGQTDFGKLFTLAAAAFATFAITFAPTLNNHTPAIVCSFFAIEPFLKTRNTPLKLRSFVISGFFAGFLATFELPAFSLLAALAIAIVLATRRTRPVVGFALGAMVPITALMLCNYRAMGTFSPAYGEFGGPLYSYPGSHWLKVFNPVQPRGIDFNRESTLVYATHLLVGHHGWFSLTPIWLIALVALLGSVGKWIAAKLPTRAPASGAMFHPGAFALLTLCVSAVVFGFYLSRTLSYNYGGNTSAARWLLWLTPLWLMGLLWAADRLAASPKKLGRFFAYGCLAFAVFSVFYPVSNPWRSPWIQQAFEQLGWVRY